MTANDGPSRCSRADMAGDRVLPGRVDASAWSRDVLPVPSPPKRTVTGRGTPASLASRSVTSSNGPTQHRRMLTRCTRSPYQALTRARRRSTNAAARASPKLAPVERERSGLEEHPRFVEAVSAVAETAGVVERVRVALIVASLGSSVAIAPANANPCVKSSSKPDVVV